MPPIQMRMILQKSFLNQIRKATRSIQLATPYFSPSDTLVELLKAATKRGVKVEILLSEYSSYPTYVTGKKIAGELIRSAIHIYYYQPTMLHLKMMVIDEDWAAIGSCNLDGLSLYKNQEAMIVATNKDFVSTLVKPL